MVLVFQTDNRPNLDYALLSRDVNEKMASYLGYEYSFLDMNTFDNPYNLHPATLKIFIVNDLLNKLKDGDIFIFLDSDAWIQDAVNLKSLMEYFVNTDKDGMYSRDPYLAKNTYINSGSFVLKVNENNRKLYSIIVNKLSEDTSHLYQWPYDQYYISSEIYKSRDRFLIFVPNILNTPKGIIFRHNWFKRGNMYDDLKRLLVNELVSDMNEVELYYELMLDECEYPNVSVDGYEYDD